MDKHFIVLLPRVGNPQILRRADDGSYRQYLTAHSPLDAKIAARRLNEIEAVVSDKIVAAKRKAMKRDEPEESTDVDDEVMED